MNKTYEIFQIVLKLKNYIKKLLLSQNPERDQTSEIGSNQIFNKVTNVKLKKQKHIR